MARKYEGLTKERIEEVLKGNGDMAAKEILEKLDVEINSSTMERIRQITDHSLYVDVKKKGRTNLYFYIEDDKKNEEAEEKKEEEPVKEDNPYKNDEKYNDPTAGKAINNVSGPSNSPFMPAGIYRDTLGDLFLVVREYPDTILGYKVLTVDNGNVTTDSSVVWKSSMNPMSYLVNTNRVCSVNRRKLQRQLFTRCPFDTYRAIIRRSPFSNCKVVEIPVEKVVEKIVELPVEVVKEVVKEVPVEIPVEKTVDTSVELQMAMLKISMLQEFNDQLYALLGGCCNVGQLSALIDKE